LRIPSASAPIRTPMLCSEHWLSAFLRSAAEGAPMAAVALGKGDQPPEATIVVKARASAE